jgi:hypothetical protein
MLLCHWLWYRHPIIVSISTGTWLRVTNVSLPLKRSLESFALLFVTLENQKKKKKWFSWIWLNCLIETTFETSEPVNYIQELYQSRSSCHRFSSKTASLLQPRGQQGLRFKTQRQCRSSVWQFCHNWGRSGSFYIIGNKLTTQDNKSDSQWKLSELYRGCLPRELVQQSCPAVLASHFTRRAL